MKQKSIFLHSLVTVDLLEVHDVNLDLATKSVQRGHVGNVFFSGESVSEQHASHRLVILSLCDINELVLSALCGRLQKLETKLKEKTAATVQPMCQI